MIAEFRHNLPALLDVECKTDEWGGGVLMVKDSVLKLGIVCLIFWGQG